MPPSRKQYYNVLLDRPERVAIFLHRVYESARLSRLLRRLVAA